MVIKIDIDGVIRDLLRAMCEVFNNEFDEHVQPCDIKEYNVNEEPHFRKIKEKYPSITPHEYFFREYRNEVFFDYAFPFLGAKQAIDKLRLNGHKVVIVTKQIGISNKMNALKFLDKNGINYDDICFTADKWSINGDYLIDDNPEFLEDEREMSKKLIIDAPYNRDKCKQIPRFNNLCGAVEYILGDSTYHMIYNADLATKYEVNSYIPDCCKNCPNYKDGFNVCNCVTPYMSKKGFQITCNYEFDSDKTSTHAPIF